MSAAEISKVPGRLDLVGLASNGCNRVSRVQRNRNNLTGGVPMDRNNHFG